MSKPVVQTSFNAGEWAPALNARVDLAKYHSGAALLRNWFVDYRGGATTRPGSKYIIKTRNDTGARLIRFQASATVTYILEFGNNYIRFINQGNPVLETATTISAITKANPGVITDTAHGYSNFDWIFIQNVGGMTQLNGNYYIIANATTNTYTLLDLFGNNVDTTNFGTYTTGGTAQRVYTISSPYTNQELFGIRFVQNVNELILCHPNHPPYALTLVTATNWTLVQIAFGPTISTPTGLSTSTTLAGGSVNYAYVVTAVDINNTESGPSAFATISSAQDIRSVAGTNTISWSAVTNAVSYNVYRAVPRYGAAVPAGSQFGFVGNVTATTFIDSNITPDFTQGPPIVQNPFSGSGVQSIVMSNTGGGTYQNVNVPAVTLSGGGGSGATAQAVMTVGSSSINAGGALYTVGQIIAAQGNAGGFTVQITSVDVNGGVLAYNVISPGSVTSGSLAATLLMNFGGSGPFAGQLVLNVIWIIQTTQITASGTGYSTPPSVAYSTGGGAATAVLGATSSGNPTVAGIKDQRLIFAGPVFAPQQFNASQPGAFFNFNTSFPLQPDDAFQEALASTTLNTIQSLTPVTQGLLALTDQAAWIINGGTVGAPLSAISLAANPQSYAGASALPPIVTPTDLLYVQAKNSIVRDIRYDFYLATYVGTDISIISSHLFYGFQLIEWAWSEEPFKVAWAVRNDGQMLSLTFLKEQDLVAWAHHDSQGGNGLYKSVASVTEISAIGLVDAVYNIVQRTINGATVQYIERFVELNYPNDYKSSWQVDAGIGYNSSPAVTFQGAQHLAGMACTGLADGVVINFTMPTSGIFSFGNGGTPGLTAIPSASIVTVGLAFTPQLQTLALDLGEPTVQGKRKKIAAVTARVRNALGLSAGTTIANALPMQDLILNNVGSMSNQLVTGLVTSDARMFMDPDWNAFGQYVITQPNPYPATVLGVIPEIEIGDDA